MTVWLRDMMVTVGLVIFMGSAFGLAAMAQAAMTSG
jgi:hypothetical protein